MFTFVLLLTVGFQPPGSNRPAPVKITTAHGTPEQAVRTFYLAMIAKDEAALRAVTLPNNDFDWLLKGEGMPADKIAGIQAMITKMPIRALKAGDEFTLPGGQKVKVQPAEITAGSAVMLPEGAPMPHRCQKVEGQWRVDASPIIAGRKAAAAAGAKADPGNR